MFLLDGLEEELDFEDDWLDDELDEAINDLLLFEEDLDNELEGDFMKSIPRKRARANLPRRRTPKPRKKSLSALSRSAKVIPKKLALKRSGYQSKIASFEPSVSRVFEEFGYLSDKFPRKHNARLKEVANEIVNFNIKTVVIVGHAFGSTMERKYNLGFRRALNTALKLKLFIKKQENELLQFPKMLIASFGDTIPRMGATESQDRRVEIIYRRLYQK